MDWIPGLGREKSGMLIFRKYVKRIEEYFGALAKLYRELILVEGNSSNSPFRKKKLQTSF
jgi:hypothetical protein